MGDILNHIRPGELRVGDDVTVEDLLTTDDCERASLSVTRVIVSIETQLAENGGADRSWVARANGALRLQKAALQAIQNKRGALQRKEKQERMNTQDRLILNAVREIAPQVFKDALAKAAERAPHLFNEA